MIQGLAAELADRRPAPEQRCFTSASVEAAIQRVGADVADPQLRRLFANTLPNTLDTAVRHADSCSGGGRSTALIFRSPAFNLDPVNTYKQQANFQRRVRPMVEAAGGITFLDFYTATRDAALQNTPHAIRFDHFSTFHYFDAGRYLQAQTLLHALKLLNTLGSTGTAVPVTLGGG